MTNNTTSANVTVNIPATRTAFLKIEVYPASSNRLPDYSVISFAGFPCILVNGNTVRVGDRITEKDALALSRDDVFVIVTH